MPYIQTGSKQKDTVEPGIKDVYHSTSVFANNVELAVWKKPQDTAAFILSLATPEVSYILEQADVDSVDTESAVAIATNIQAAVTTGTTDGLLTTATTSATALLPLPSGGTVDLKPSLVAPAAVYSADWSQFNENNIAYDTLMLTTKTSLATFTTKSALWKNQPTPAGPAATYVTGVSAGDNKYIVEQDFYQGGKVAGRITVPQILHNLSNLAKNIYEPLKEQYPQVVITNTFRQSPPGGKSRQAQHGLGMAMDVVFPGKTAADYYDIAVWIRDNLPIDQLLQEKAGSTIWLHISHYSGYGYQVSPINKIANCIVSPVYSFTPGLSILS